MRVPVLMALALIGLAAPAMAQTAIYAAPEAPISVPYGSAPAANDPPPPPGGYPMPPGYSPPAAPAPAPRALRSGANAAPPAGGYGIPPGGYGVPVGANPATGARPGNDIGTGQSLPISNQASNIDPATTRSSIAPRLPTPTAGDDATTRQYLTNARDALASGRTGEGQEALERAETRMLDRSVAPEQVNDAIHGPAIEDVTAARRALANGDVPGAMQTINAALARR